MNQEEKVVDEQLNKFLENELPQTNVRNVDVDQEEFAEDDVLDSTPISNSTKQKLLHYLRQNSPEINDAKKLVQILYQINKMSEQEASNYLTSIQHISAAQSDSEIVRLIINQLTEIFFNPSQPKFKSDCINDRYVLNTATNMMMDIFGQIGNISGAIVFVLYGVASWYKKEINYEVAKDAGNNQDNKEESSP